MHEVDPCVVKADALLYVGRTSHVPVGNKCERLVLNFWDGFDNEEYEAVKCQAKAPTPTLSDQGSYVRY